MNNGKRIDPRLALRVGGQESALDMQVGAKAGQVGIFFARRVDSVVLKPHQARELAGKLIESADLAELAAENKAQEPKEEE